MGRIGTLFLGCLGVLGLCLTAQAQDRDALRARADCAQIELSAAMGESVSAAALQQCQSQASAAPKRVEAKPRAVPNSKKISRDRPGWIDQPPVQQGMLFGTGEGPTVQSAFGQATAGIAAQVQVTIRSEVTDERSEEARESSRNGRTVSSSVEYRERIGATSKMMTNQVLDDVIIMDQYRDPKTKRFHVLACLDMAALAAKEEAIVNAALSALSAAAEKLARQRSEGTAISQEALFELAAVLDDVKALGRSRIGRKAREHWRKPYGQFRRLVNRALTCVEVTLEGKKEITVQCNGGALANARLKTRVKGGLADIPAMIETDANGKATLTYGRVYGGERIRVGFMHDLTGVAGSRWLSPSKPSPKAWVPLKATHPLTVKLTVMGTRGDAEFNEAAEALASWVSRKWGAKVVRGKGAVQVTLKLTFGNADPVGDRFAISSGIALSATGASGPIFERSGKAGALGDSEEDVRKRALTNIIRAFQKW